MEKPAETITPSGDKHSAFLPGFIVWPFVILVLYILCYGPVEMMILKGPVSLRNEFLDKFYAPLNWAYDETPLHKPLGMYLHLWIPQFFDKHGEDLANPN